MAVTIDTTEFNRALKAFARQSRTDISEVVRYQARLLFKRIADFTPPGNNRSYRKAQAASMGRKNLTPLRQGRLRVEKDLWKAARPLRSHMFTGKLRKRMRQVIDKKDHQAITAIMKNMRVAHLKNAQSVSFTPAFHYSQRDSRGRVRRIKPFVTPDWDVWKEHLVRIKKNVGRGRGGWATAISRTGGRVPMWYGKWAGMGRTTDSLKSISPSVTSFNLSEWAARGDDDRAIKSAIDTRTRDIYTSLAHVIGRNARRNGFKFKWN